MEQSSKQDMTNRTEQTTCLCILNSVVNPNLHSDQPPFKYIRIISMCFTCEAIVDHPFCSLDVRKDLMIMVPQEVYIRPVVTTMITREIINPFLTNTRMFRLNVYQMKQSTEPASESYKELFMQYPLIVGIGKDI